MQAAPALALQAAVRQDVRRREGAVLLLQRAAQAARLRSAPFTNPPARATSIL